MNKGKWDKSRGSLELNREYNLSWLSLCQKLLKQNGTIWVFGMHCVTYSVKFTMHIDWRKTISKKLCPEDTLLMIIREILFIIEVKYQQVEGSVDENCKHAISSENDTLN